MLHLGPAARFDATHELPSVSSRSFCQPKLEFRLLLAAFFCHVERSEAESKPLKLLRRFSELWMPSRTENLGSSIQSPNPTDRIETDLHRYSR